MVEGHEQLLLQVVSTDDPQEVESLLGRLGDDSGVGSPEEILSGVCAQEPEVRTLPHRPH